MILLKGDVARVVQLVFDVPMASDGGGEALWTARQLLAVAKARMAAENRRHPSVAADAAIACLDLASARCHYPAGRLAREDAITFDPGGETSPYPWTVARCGDFHLPLCPDPAGLEEGITPEQLLIILDQLLHDATRACPQARDLWACRRHVAAALAAEVRRLATVRA